MKYCLKYTNICTKLNDADEIQIEYSEDKGLIDFLEKHCSKRVILLIKPAQFSQNEIRKLIAIKKQHPNYNFAVALTYDDKVLTSLFYQENIPFYINTPCTNWEDFIQLLEDGVSDINLSGPLAFEKTKVKRVLKSFNRKVQIRVTPNRIINLNSYTPLLIGFFIRPEDAYLYEDFIDVFEFDGIEHQDSFFSIYAEQKFFLGKLNQLIYGIEKPIDNNGLLKSFGERRVDCGRQCLHGGYCRRCFDLVDISSFIGSCARERILETLKKEQEKINNGKDLSD